MKRIAMVLAVLLVTACTKGPEPIRWGSDMCDQCRMILSDKRFGAELVAQRVYKFDGIDELARFQSAHPETKGAAYVTDGETGNLVPAQQAVFIDAPDLKAPMGGHIISFAQRPEAQQFVARHQLHEVRWLSFTEALAQTKGGMDAGH